MTTQTERIRCLNDELRQHLIGGAAVMTPGVARSIEMLVDPEHLPVLR